MEANRQICRAIGGDDGERLEHAELDVFDPDTSC